MTTNPTGAPATPETPDKGADRLSAPRSVVRRFLRGRETDAPWVRPSLLALLLGTAVLYVWGLGAAGWSNGFYSAAVQAASTSWKAFFFGSLDAGNSITVDKPPASLWPMALSVRLFGLNSWAILIPQALMGIASVGVLYAACRRVATPAAGLIAGGILAITPVALMMFRYNNPDALLVLLLVLAAYAVTRAIEADPVRWLVLAGALVGFAFLAKQLQALVVLPPLALVVLVAARASLWRRIGGLLLAGLAMVAAAGWWVAIVELVPVAARPYIGGSQNNSILELTLGYNGLGRITGDEVGSVGGAGGPGGPGAQGGPGGAGAWGETGLLRMFGTDAGGQIAWLLPAALLLLIVGLVLRGRAPRTDPLRAGLILWGGWTIVTALVFSLMQGIFHAYYTIALAPGIAAVVGMAGTELWARRRHALATVVLAVLVSGTAVWSYVLLDRSPDFQPWLRPAVLVVGGLAVLTLIAARWLGRPLVIAAASITMVTALLGSASYAIVTIIEPPGDAIPSAGPRATGMAPAGMVIYGKPPGGAKAGAAPPPGAVVMGAPPAGGVTRGPGGPDGQGGPAGGPGGPGEASDRGGAGGLLNASKPSAALAEAIEKDASAYTWPVATVGSNGAAGYQLATELPAMAIGGFNGSDPSPTLDQFKAYVENGEIHYFVEGDMAGGGLFQTKDGYTERVPTKANGGSSVADDITTWVKANFDGEEIGGVTVYDLSS